MLNIHVFQIVSNRNSRELPHFEWVLLRFAKERLQIVTLLRSLWRATDGQAETAAWRLLPASASSAQAAFQPPRLVGRSLGEG